MKFILILLLTSFSVLAGDEAEALIQIRNLYEKSAASKASNDKLLKLLHERGTKSPLIQGYKGAALMMEANHVLNPLTKWNRFRTGRDLIEKAVRAEPGNIETRYIRLTIQTNLPGFLRYNSDIQKDKTTIIGQLSQVKDQDLATRMANYLLSAGICSSQEILTIESWKNR